MATWWTALWWRLTLSSANSHGKKFNLIITTEDKAGNGDTHTTQLTIDTVKPRLAGNPTVGQAWDADKNQAKSSANSILVKFDESLDVDTVAASDFTVAGYTIDSVEVVGTNDDAADGPHDEEAAPQRVRGAHAHRGPRQ